MFQVEIGCRTEYVVVAGRVAFLDVEARLSVSVVFFLVTSVAVEVEGVSL
jgi:hypothetical protein